MSDVKPRAPHQLALWAEPELPQGSTPYHHQRRQRLRGFVLLGLVAIALLGLRPAPYVQFLPGPVFSVPMTPDPPDGDFNADRWNYTTVLVAEVNGFQWMLATLLGKTADLHPSLGMAEAVDAAEQKLMNDSKRVAWAVANELAGRRESTVPAGSDIVLVEAGSAAESAGLTAGETITVVDGVAVTGTEMLQGLVLASSQRPLTLTVTSSDGQQRTVVVTPAGTPEQPRIGVQLTDHLNLEEPTYAINTDGVTGPSAGMIFTLAYLDALSPGDLSGGDKIAGTGTIDVRGNVGPIGGVSQKIEGAVRDGATVFFVDPADAADATAAADGRIPVVAVKTAKEAADWLCDRGAKDGYCRR